MIRRPRGLYANRRQEIRPGKIVQSIRIGFPAFEIIKRYLPGEVVLPEQIRVEQDKDGIWYCATDIGTYHGFRYSTGSTETTLDYLREGRDSIRARLAQLGDLDRRLEKAVSVLEDGEALSKEIAEYMRRHVVESIRVSEHPNYRQAAEALANRFDDIIRKVENITDCNTVSAHPP